MESYGKSIRGIALINSRWDRAGSLASAGCETGSGTHPAAVTYRWNISAFDSLSVPVNDAAFSFLSGDVFIDALIPLDKLAETGTLVFAV